MEITKLNDSRIKELNNYHFVGHNKPWYGERLNERFDSFVFNELTKKPDGYSNVHIIKHIVEVYKKTVLDLKSDYGINVYDYTGKILPIVSKVCPINTDGRDVTKFNCWPIVKKIK